MVRSTLGGRVNQLVWCRGGRADNRRCNQLLQLQMSLAGLVSVRFKPQTAINGSARVMACVKCTSANGHPAHELHLCRGNHYRDNLPAFRRVPCSAARWRRAVNFDRHLWLAHLNIDIAGTLSADAPHATVTMLAPLLERRARGATRHAAPAAAAGAGHL